MKHSLRTKAVLLIVLITVVLGVASIVVSSQALRQVVDDSYRNRARDVANTAAVVIDADKAALLKNAIMAIYNATKEKVSSDEWGSDAFNAYINRYAAIEQTEDFQTLQRQLRSIQDVNDVDCLYLLALDPVEENVVYIVDGAYEDADAFSIYAVVVTERYITTPDGLTYRVKVTYDANANIPEGASLEVTEVGSEAYLPQAMDVIGGRIEHARFFDITIMADGVEIQPEAPVTVQVTLEDAPEAVRTVHFGEDAVTEVSSSCEEGVISFTADGFSVYGFIYTVDFDYTDEEGHTYTWKLNGGSAMLLSELFERLNIEVNLTNSAARFSDDMPEGLVELVPVTADGLVVDWQITSRAPFSTEHQLIVTLADGTEIIIGVTDQTYTDLRELLTSATLLDGDGNIMSEPWSVSLGQSYTLKLVFSETQEKQFVDAARRHFTGHGSLLHHV